MNTFLRLIRPVQAPFWRYERWVLSVADGMPLFSGFWFWLMVGFGPLALLGLLLVVLPANLAPDMAAFQGLLPALPGLSEKLEEPPELPSIAVIAAVLLPALLYWLVGVWHGIRSFFIGATLLIGMRGLAQRRRTRLTQLLGE